MILRSKPLPTRTYLRECFEYDPMSGVAIWLERPIDHFDSYRAYRMWNGKFAFGRVGNLHKITGYYHTSLNGEQYTVHRLVWKWWYGTDPLEIDHIDRNRINNSIINLKNVTNYENTQNRTLSSNNTSGYPGVTYDYNSYKWVARAYYKGKRIALGYHNTIEEAIAAIKRFKQA